MGWDHDDAGSFADQKAAEDWAKSNNIDLRDTHIRNDGRGVTLSVRRSALGNSARRDNRYGRNDGFF